MEKPQDDINSFKFIWTADEIWEKEFQGLVPSLKIEEK